MNFHILTLFPKMFDGAFSESMIKRALAKGLIDIKIYDLRDWGLGKHKQVDDTPYGGGAGMVMRFDVLSNAISNISASIDSDRQLTISKKKKPKTKDQRLKTILLTPQGKKLDQNKVRQFVTSGTTDFILICGHYEGFDERVRDLVDEEISIGDYVLTGGEIPAMILVDSVSRLLPGVLGKEESHQEESFDKNLLEYPHYTRPPEFKGKKVPEVLISGDHKKIKEWREKEAVKRTKKKRPDLLK